MPNDGESIENYVYDMLGSISTSKQVCVIGAGSFGLISMKQIKASKHLSGIVFEKTDRVGGLWHYVHDVMGRDVNGLPVQSPVYGELM